MAIKYNLRLGQVLSYLRRVGQHHIKCAIAMFIVLHFVQRPLSGVLFLATCTRMWDTSRLVRVSHDNDQLTSFLSIRSA